MNWRVLSYPLAFLIGTEAAVTASVFAWRKATWDMPDPGWVFTIMLIAGLAAVIYGAAIGYEAALKAVERQEIRDKHRQRIEEQALAAKERFMDKYGVPPDPDIVAPDFSKRAKKRDSAV